MNVALQFAVVLLLSFAAMGHGQNALTNKWPGIAQLLESGRPKAAAAGAAKAAAVPENPRFTRTAEGHLETLSAAPGFEFPTVAGPAGQPDVTAKNFVKQHGALFGVTSAAVDFQLKKKNSTRGKHSVRLTQTYDGVPVFGGEMVVQVNDAGGVEYASSNFDRDTADLDQKRLSTKPTLTANEAAAAARAQYAPLAPGQALAVTPPELNLFVPALLKLAGPKRLTWKMEVRSADETTVARRVFIDAHSGAYVQDIPLHHQALFRQIFDATNTTVSPGGLVRSEGGPASVIADVNLAYDQLADVYNFYFSRFGRDGIYNDGSNLLATVRYIHVNAQTNPSPNASWNGVRMNFDPGWVCDDVTGHEMTHGVIQAESGLIYLNESGALNESLADIFGEFVDLVNGRGNDSNSVRWLVGEELPIGTIRSMSSPTNFSNPDWLGSTFYTAPATNCAPGNDCGGVHNNSGVNNKLCYLLTDGDTFRGFTVTGMGMEPVAALYYEANLNLLMSSSGWADLYHALQQAAINLGWNTTQRANLDQALAAVGLLTLEIYVDETSSTSCTQTGDAICTGLGDGGPARSLATGLNLLPANLQGHIHLQGTGHSTRIARPTKIRAWNGPARIVP